MRTTTVDGFYLESVEIVQWEGIGIEPPLSTIGNSRIYFDPITGKTRISENGGAWEDLSKPAVDLSGHVPYSGATGDVNLGTHNLTTTGEITGEMAKVDEDAPAEVVGNLWLDVNDDGSGGIGSGDFVPYSGATKDVDLGYNGVILEELQSKGSGGLSIKADNGDVAVLIGAGSGKNATFYDGVKLDAQTASKALFLDASKNITTTGIGTSSEFLKGDGSLDATKKLTEIKNVLIAAACTSFDVTGLDGDADEIYVVDCYIKNAYNGAATFFVSINDDTGNNYGLRYIVSAASLSQSVSTTVNYIIAFGSTAINRVSFATMHLWAKSGTTRASKVHISRDVSGKGINNTHFGSGTWENTADNITKLTITGSQANSIGIGSYFRMYTMR